MEQYIPKSVLVAEIERLACPEHGSLCDKLLEFLDSLEVKEVDLEKEYEEFVVNDPVYNKLVNGIVGKAIAKHFYELGIKAQKGEMI